MADVSGVIKHFPVAQEGFTTTLASTISSGAVTVPLNSVAGYDNGDVVVFIVDPTDATKKQAFTGTIDTTGVQVTGVVWTEGTNQTHTAGSTVVDYETATAWSMMTKGILLHADEDGALLPAAVRAALGITDTATQGWYTMSTTPTVATGYNKGNKSFELDTASDLSAILSPGMRMKLGTSGFTVPTQCTDLEASSSQYWSKSSPSGITFTDDFTCEAWVKLESYGVGGIVARRNADTEGWDFTFNASGQLTISALRIASNNRTITTNQSLPLNRWVHVAASMDLSGGNYAMYIDGVAVGTSTATAGTITALVQGTTALVVGAQKSAGTNPFDGEIAEVRVWSVVRTATEIQDNMCKVLTGSESNLVAYFPMNGNGNDSTSNANNLSANGGATATTTDNPFNLNSGTHYGIITNVTASKITVFTGTDSFIPNGTLVNPYYSTQSTPFGFPRGRDKWFIDANSLVDSDKSSPTVGVWYGSTGMTSNGLSLSVPIGSWNLSYRGSSSTNSASGTAASIGMQASLSTSASSESDKDFTTEHRGTNGSATAQKRTTLSAEKAAFVASQTTYHLITQTNDSAVGTIAFKGTQHPTIIRAECAYL